METQCSFFIYPYYTVCVSTVYRLLRLSAVYLKKVDGEEMCLEATVEDWQ